MIRETIIRRIVQLDMAGKPCCCGSVAGTKQERRSCTETLAWRTETTRWRSGVNSEVGSVQSARHLEKTLLRSIPRVKRFARNKPLKILEGRPEIFLNSSPL